MNTWRRAFIAASNEGQWTRAFVKASASIVAVVINASVAPCASHKTCLSIAVTIRSRLSDPVPLSDLTAWQRLKESESVTIGLRKESISTVLKDRGREVGTEIHISARTDRRHCASSTASDTEYASGARVLRTTRLMVLLVQNQMSELKFPMPETPGLMRQQHDDAALIFRSFYVGEGGVSIRHQLSRGHIDHSTWISQSGFRGSLSFERNCIECSSIGNCGCTGTLCCTIYFVCQIWT